MHLAEYGTGYTGQHNLQRQTRKHLVVGDDVNVSASRRYTTRYVALVLQRGIRGQR